MSVMVVHDGARAVLVEERTLGAGWNPRNPSPSDGGEDALALARRGQIAEALDAADAFVGGALRRLLDAVGQPSAELRPPFAATGWEVGGWRWLHLDDVRARYEARRASALAEHCLVRGAGREALPPEYRL